MTRSPLLTERLSGRIGSAAVCPAALLIHPLPAGLAYSVDSANTVTVYHTDGLGSVRALTNGSGTLVQTSQTDPFGNVAQSQGSSSQPFGYTGQQVDGNGLVYLRARYYDPSSRRFMQRDPLAGTVAAPLSLNRYSYVENDPLALTDPSGLTPSNKPLKAPNCLDPMTNCGGMGSPICLPFVGCVSLAGIIKEFGKHGDEGGSLPQGFSSRQQFSAFSARIKGALAQAGYRDVQVAIRGSAVTGVSWDTGAPFDSAGLSDIDVAVVSPSLLSDLARAGAELRGGGTRTGPIAGYPMFSDLSEMLSGRSVSIMVYRSLADVAARGDYILAP